MSPPRGARLLDCGSFSPARPSAGMQVASWPRATGMPAAWQVRMGHFRDVDGPGQPAPHPYGRSFPRSLRQAGHLLANRFAARSLLRPWLWTHPTTSSRQPLRRNPGGEVVWGQTTPRHESGYPARSGKAGTSKGLRADLDQLESERQQQEKIKEEEEMARRREAMEKRERLERELEAGSSQGAAG